MGYTVKLATSGIAGVTNLVPAILTQANNNAVVGVNSVSALQGAAAYTIMLPENPEPGAIVEFKNLVNEDPANAPATFLVTIDRNDNMIDGTPNNITTETRNEVFKLIFVNPTLGWLVI